MSSSVHEWSAKSLLSDPRKAADREVTWLVSGGIALIAAVMLGNALLAIDFYQRDIATAKRELQKIAFVAAEEASRTFQTIELVQTSVIDSMRSAGIRSSEDYEREFSGYETFQRLSSSIAILPQVETFGLVNAEGKLFNFSGNWPAAPIDVSDRPFFEVLKLHPNKLAVLSKPQRGYTTDTETLYFARKFPGPQNEFIGAVVGSIRLSYFESFFKEISFGNNATLALYRDDGVLLAVWPHPEEWIGRSTPLSKSFAEDVLRSGSRIVQQVATIDGQERLIAGERVPHYPVVANATTTVSAALTGWRKEVALLGAEGFLIAVIIAGAVWHTARQWVSGHQLSQKRLEAERFKLSTAINNISQGISMFDGSGKLVLFNERYRQLHGMPPGVLKAGLSLEQLVRLRIGSGTFDGNPSDYIAPRRAKLAGGETFSELVETRGGRVLQFVANPLIDGGWISTFEDITERHAAERRAEAAHDRLRDAIEAVPEGIAIFDAEDRLVIWNRRYGELAAEDDVAPREGCPFAELLRDRVSSGQYPSALGHEEEWVEELLAGHGKLQNHADYEKAGGRWLRIEERRLPDGGSVVVHLDITELKQREASFRLLFEANPVPMWVFDRTTLKFLAVNDSALRQYGYSREQFLTMTPLDIRPPEDRAEVQKLVQGSYKSVERTWRHLKSDGTLMQVAVFAQPLRYAGYDASIAAIFDLTERKRAEDELQRTKTFLDTTIEHVPVVIAVKNARDLTYAMINRAGETLLGLSKDVVIGKTPHELFPESMAEDIVARDRRALSDHSGQNFEEQTVPTSLGARSTRCARVVIPTDGEPEYLMSVIEDITERKEMQRQLVHAQKMEAIGNLTGGLAHDFNNLLMIIIGNLDLLESELQGNAATAEYVRTIMEASLRGAELTRRLLTFSRRQALAPATLDLNELVTRTSLLLKRTLGEDIRIELKLGSSVWPVYLDQPQLEAAILNMAINSRDAMANGGVLAISTENAELDASPTGEEGGPQPGEYVILEITDSGVGMPSDVMARIFEPFFTTKAPGKGTGLGLSMVYGYVKQSGGCITVSSEPGMGSCFRLYFPRAQVRQDRDLGSTSASDAPKGRGEIILVVDDHDDVRGTAVRQLRHLGYEVLEAQDGASALKVLDTGQRIDLLFTDIVMPGALNGKVLADVARTRRPDLRVLFTSGFTGRTGGDVDLSHELFITKPYRKANLARAVRDALIGKIAA